MIRLTDEEKEREIGKLPGKGYGVAVFRKDVPIEYKSREDILADGIAKAQLKKVVELLSEREYSEDVGRFTDDEWQALLEELKNE